MSSPKVVTRIVFGYVAACVTVSLGLWVPPALVGTASVIINGPPYPDHSHFTTILIVVIYALITTFSTCCSQASRRWL